MSKKLIKVKALQKCFYGMRRVNKDDVLEIPEKDLNPDVFEKLVPEVTYVSEKKQEKLKDKDEDVI